MPRLFPPILPLSRHANAHAPKSEHLVPRADGPFADNPQRCLTSGDEGRPDVPCQATGLSPSQDEFSETHTEPINTRNIPVKQNGAAAMRRPPRNVSGGPQSADYPIRVSPCQLIWCSVMPISSIQRRVSNVLRLCVLMPVPLSLFQTQVGVGHRQARKRIDL